MRNKSKTLWIERAYVLVAQNGFKSLSIESLARHIQKNKSSFYHYFGDMETFEKALFDYHRHLAVDFVAQARACQNIIPDMIDLFMAHKTDLFFHKQLRINRNQPSCKKCFEEVYELFEEAILAQWVQFLQMEQQSFLARKFLTLLSENFLLQITDDNYNKEWFLNYLKEVAGFVGDISSRNY